VCVSEEGKSRVCPGLKSHLWFEQQKKLRDRDKTHTHARARVHTHTHTHTHTCRGPIIYEKEQKAVNLIVERQMLHSFYQYRYVLLNSY